MENNNEFEDALKHHAGGFSMQPGAASFNAIQKKLQQKRRRRLGFIFLLTGTAAASLALITLFLLPADETGTAKAESSTDGTQQQMQKEPAAATPGITYENKNYTEDQAATDNNETVKAFTNANAKNKTGNTKQGNSNKQDGAEAQQKPVFTNTDSDSRYGIDRERIEDMPNGGIADNGNITGKDKPTDVLNPLKTDSAIALQSSRPGDKYIDKNKIIYAWDKSRFTLSLGTGILISAPGNKTSTTNNGCNCPSENSLKSEGGTVLSETLTRQQQSGYSFNFAAEYRVAKRVNISLGIGAWQMQQQQQFTHTETVYQPAYDIKNYFVDSNHTFVRTADTSYNSASSSVSYGTTVYSSFVNIPLTVSYNFFPARRVSVGMYGGAGLTLLHRSYHNVRVLGTDDTQSAYAVLVPVAPISGTDPFQTTINTREANINAVVGLQATYKVNRWLGLYAGANTNFRAFSLSGAADKSVQSSVLFGINSGIKLFF